MLFHIPENLSLLMFFQRLMHKLLRHNRLHCALAITREDMKFSSTWK
jgi:hypothetical protein